MAGARAQQAAAAAAAAEASKAQQLAEASRTLLADLERALDAREAKLHDSWKTFKTQLATGLGDGSGASLLHSDQRLRDDAQAAALEAAGRSPSPLPSVGSSSTSADLVRVLHQRRTQLVEKETALQVGDGLSG